MAMMTAQRQLSPMLAVQAFSTAIDGRRVYQRQHICSRNVEHSNEGMYRYIKRHHYHHM
ncbi:hypothetical protein P171DRAFT_437139 [Karstenula rhodostoma CBS 690.94]|uniref:Uncharacterized protein n=1 Tax=Karstenula rhodostoma CBS 690.94 TaxID=1392251 RepID=A0A9P4P7B9_9PLEO|nr:hypothetical protein P171DRAFT_437139 [Karstenula rhodostoma CBS 690.94]